MEYKNKIDLISEEIVGTTSEFLKINSILSEPIPNAIFGEGIGKALDYALALCEKFGFKTFKHIEGYYGYAEIGEGSKLVGILTHVDVVDAGDLKLWNYPPFSGTVEDGNIYSRGAQDDKGPIIAVIYAIKALIDSGLNFTKRVRVIFATDEENTWRGIEKYKKTEEFPYIGFVPDSMFPLTNSEKGLLQVKISSSAKTDYNINIPGTFNVIPWRAGYNTLNDDLFKVQLQKLNYDYLVKNKEVTVIGKSGHSSTPERGVNSISRLIIAVKNIGINLPIIDFLFDTVANDYLGKNLGDFKDFISGNLTVNISSLLIENENQEVCLDIRIPVTFTIYAFLTELTKKASEYNLNVVKHDSLDPLYIAEKAEIVKVLKKVYIEETGNDNTPVTNGGATYARALPNFVAFGPNFPNEEMTEHQPNEYIKIDNLIKITKIYATAIKELVELA
jgi:succinyl-diaminopimelate desuccinylase